MSFAEAVRSTPEVEECLEAGLQALGSNRRKIRVTSTRDLAGSVNIDACLANRYPNAPRWDYVFGYKDRVYYIEVHQGRTGEMENVIAKLKWLKRWRKRAANSLEELRERSTYHWIASGRVDSEFAKDDKYRRKLLQNRILGPDSVLRPDAGL